jgi:transposase
MILLTHETRILLCVAPADFRRGIDGFVAQCQNSLALQPRDGSVVVFINRARTMIRALSYDVNGYWLMTKRLSRGKFTGWPDGQRALSATSARELRIILSGRAVPPGNDTTTVRASPLSNAVLASAVSSATIMRNRP